MSALQEKKTAETARIEQLLLKHFPNHSTAHPPTVYRYNSASIRIRIVDDCFNGKTRSERERLVLPLLDKLSEETQSDITVLLLLTPEEMGQSLMNLEFENPTPSRV
jgi:stress-induced morphogen